MPRELGEEGAATPVPAQRTEYLVNCRQERLFCRYWHVEHPRGLVFVSHGFSEHLGMYDSVARALGAEDLLAFGHDHVGHGESDGKRAYADDMDDLVKDVRRHCVKVRDKYDGVLPLFCVGHSMGGMVALRAAIKYQDLFDGVVLQGPLIIPGPQLGPFDARINLIRYLPVVIALSILDVINPEMVLGRIFPSLITRDQEMSRQLHADPLRWEGGRKVRLLLAFVDCLEENFFFMADMKTPFLALHGTSDSLCNVNGSRMLHKHAKATDKEIVEFEGARHQLYYELPEVRREAVKKTVDWISERALPQI